MKNVISIYGNNKIAHTCIDLILKYYSEVNKIYSVTNSIKDNLKLDLRLNYIRSDYIDHKNYLNTIKESTGVIHTIEDYSNKFESCIKLARLLKPSTNLVFIAEDERYNMGINYKNKNENEKALMSIIKSTLLYPGRIDDSNNLINFPSNIFSNLYLMMKNKEIKLMIYNDL